jgi:hypothetical protein
VDKWLASRAAVRQPSSNRPGTPPLVQEGQEIQERESNGADYSQRSSKNLPSKQQACQPVNNNVLQQLKMVKEEEERKNQDSDRSRKESAEKNLEDYDF